jgi:hypothetical protein
MNITAYDTATYYRGLFGSTNGGSIKNLKFSAVNIYAKANYVGVVVGYAQGTLLENIDILSGSITSNLYVGAIAGWYRYYNTATLGPITLKGLSNNAYIRGANYVGGLIGCTETDSYGASSPYIGLYRCKNTGKIEGYYLGSYERFDKIGGLIGQCNDVGISECFNTGDVSGTRDVGGIAGYAYRYSNDFVKDSYSVGNITAAQGYNTDAPWHTGGICGNDYGLKFINVYSAGVITDPSTYKGPIVGYHTVSTTTQISGAYYDSTIFTGTATVGTGQSTAQMKVPETFPEYDFINVWGIDAAVNNGYPYLLWQ